MAVFPHILDDDQPDIDANLRHAIHFGILDVVADLIGSVSNPIYYLNLAVSGTSYQTVSLLMRMIGGRQNIRILYASYLSSNDVYGQNQDRLQILRSLYRMAPTDSCFRKRIDNAYVYQLHVEIGIGQTYMDLILHRMYIILRFRMNIPIENDNGFVYITALNRAADSGEEISQEIRLYEIIYQYPEQTISLIQRIRTIMPYNKLLHNIPPMLIFTAEDAEGRKGKPRIKYGANGYLLCSFAVSLHQRYLAIIVSSPFFNSQLLTIIKTYSKQEKL